ncbi:uncharacterized protein LOC143106302 isoform X2 [Alosa pseudoharengus]|uniref:uncharacterized protein LOC143106302 isoform X2 n=1 Tax=Alosa pseudoharengus TaxID=34774 RepID=UPI003F8A70E4
MEERRRTSTLGGVSPDVLNMNFHAEGGSVLLIPVINGSHVGGGVSGLMNGDFAEPAPKRARVNPDVMKATKSQESLKSKIVTSVSEVKHCAVDDLITIQGQIKSGQKGQLKYVPGRKQEMMMKEYLLADHSALITLTVWGDKWTICKGGWYTFCNVKVKLFEGQKKLTFTAHTKMTKCFAEPAPKRARVNPDVMKATKSQESLKSKIVTSVSEVTHCAVDDLITIQGQIMSGENGQLKYVPGRKRKMMMKEYLLADHSALITLTVWGDKRTICKGGWYKFCNVKVKLFEGKKKLTFTPHTKITEIPTP